MKNAGFLAMMMLAGGMTAVAVDDAVQQLRGAASNLHAAYVGMPCATKAHACKLKVTMPMPARLTRVLHTA